MAADSPSMHRVNYDDIAHLYDEPIRDHVVDSNLLAFLEDRGGTAPSALRVLDVGCGTGKQLGADRARFPDMVLVGLDRFGGMLRIARKRCPSVAWVQGDATAIPFASASFHYATNQFSYPHIRNPGQLVHEVFRVLRPGGRFVITNIDPWSMRGWLVYRYFPEAWELDQKDFLPADRFVSLMRDVGFEDMHVRSNDVSAHEDLQHFLTYASERHRASQFMAISDEAYTAGLRHLREAVADGRGQALEVRSEVVLVTIWGDKRQR